MNTASDGEGQIDHTGHKEGIGGADPICSICTLGLTLL